MALRSPQPIDHNKAMAEKLAYIQQQLAQLESLWAVLAYHTVEFKNGWGGNCLYTKDYNGRVFLSGRLSGGVNGTAAFIIPAGFRPKESNPTCAAAAYSGTTVGAAFLNPQPNGEVLVFYQSGFGDVGIEGVNWRAEQ